VREMLGCSQLAMCVPQLQGTTRSSPMARVALSMGALILVLSLMAQSGEPLRVGGEIKPPRKVKDAKPVYPPEAKSAKKQGTVILEVVISREGKVTSVKVVRSLPMLDQAAVEAAQQWLYAPTMVSGKPASVVMTVALNFAL
jgi:TonB family protein